LARGLVSVVVLSEVLDALTIVIIHNNVVSF